MPIYHLGIDDGICATVDGEGVEYRDVEVARRVLIATLLQILIDSGLHQAAIDLVGRITDASGAEVYAVTLSLQSQCISPVNPSINSN